MPSKFAALSMLLVATACTPISTGIATETENELCRAWGTSLFLPSRSDTEFTIAALNQQIADFEAACEGFSLRFDNLGG